MCRSRCGALALRERPPAAGALACILLEFPDGGAQFFTAHDSGPAAVRPNQCTTRNDAAANTSCTTPPRESAPLECAQRVPPPDSDPASGTEVSTEEINLPPPAPRRGHGLRSAPSSNRGRHALRAELESLQESYLALYSQVCGCELSALDPEAPPPLPAPERPEVECPRAPAELSLAQEPPSAEAVSLAAVQEELRREQAARLELQAALARERSDREAAAAAAKMAQQKVAQLQSELAEARRQLLDSACREQQLRRALQDAEERLRAGEMERMAYAGDSPLSVHDGSDDESGCSGDIWVPVRSPPALPLPSVRGADLLTVSPTDAHQPSTITLPGREFELRLTAASEIVLRGSQGLYFSCGTACGTAVDASAEGSVPLRVFGTELGVHRMTVPADTKGAAQAELLARFSEMLDVWVGFYQAHFGSAFWDFFRANPHATEVYVTVTEMRRRARRAELERRAEDAAVRWHARPRLSGAAAS